ncbi:hypothetical protein [Pseudozobellia thermophila]|uniref:Adhesin n=1 Tax=Pseudozobellia thermophila TaxID=192903 RepID=A0A1M6MIK2_9FLAO|nr:hypothetical protein [Pseudozobellia thermophila]SHJ83315.1 hypothetical protein SAMN04488513_1105 [Pseudozobellia thermophila]
MITKLLFRPIALALLTFPLLALAHEGKPKGKYTKEKTIKKEYDVNPDALLEVNNSYGNLNITSWNENRILIEVHIKTNGNNEEKVAQKLKQISVDFEASKSAVSATTNFNNNHGGWGWNWGRNNNVNMQVNYTIKVPIKGKVNLDNDYGNINLDRIDGHAKISCDYGRLDIGELRGKNNQLNFDYTSNSTIGYINSGRISADYSGFTIEKAINLIISADYTNSVIREIDNLEYSSDYGKIEVDEVNNVSGNGDYINVQLGTVHGNVDITADYGSLKIDKMDQDAGNLLIKTDYTGVKIGYDEQYHFSFEINTSYAGVKGKDRFQIQISEEKNNSKYYKGHYGSENSGNSVSISSDYGGISFYQN